MTGLEHLAAGELVKKGFTQEEQSTYVENKELGVSSVPSFDKGKLSYSTFVQFLGKEVIVVNAIFSAYKKKLAEQEHNYTADYLAKEGEALRAETAQLVASEVETVTATTEKFKDQKLTEIDGVYMSDVLPELVNDLDLIDNSELSENEMNGYLRKFADNLPAIRRFDTILHKNGYRVFGLTYDYEIDFLNYVTKQVDNLVALLQSDSEVARNIQINLLNAKLEDYNNRAMTGFKVVTLR